MTITNKLNLPEGLVRAVSKERHNKASCISATTLIQGLKHIILTERHWDELEDDVSERIWAVFGSAVHSLLESEGEYDFCEQVMEFPVGGITITGRIDNYNMQHGIICDYKTASVYKVKSGDFDDWHLQGMIYSWLLVKSGFPVTKCCFLALLKDHSLSESLREKNYPKSSVFIYEFTVTQERLDEIERFIKKKAGEYEKYLHTADDLIPPCTAKERWEKPAKYAVKKEGRKAAIRVFDTLEEAEHLAAELGDGHSVESRPGESVKCRSYCLCRSFCSYYRMEVEPLYKSTAA